ncbi:MAG: HAD family phosphatase [Bacteroidetes bacterium]|nr:HAD family phosphatase [Bacteroidota bacterium]
MSTPIDPSGIDTLVFDLGNVIIDIDYDVMIAAFRRIAARDFSELITYSAQDDLFSRYERGDISSAEFRAALRPYMVAGVSDAEIDRAWNAILYRYPSDKFDRLKALRTRYGVYALSNINEIHLTDIDRYVSQNLGATDMRSFFDHAYYSHELRMRKPESRIYQAVIDHAGIAPERSLFIDDKKENTDAAAALGFRVHHLTARDSLIELLRHF